MSGAAQYCYRFGQAEFDEGRFELRVNGTAVPLQRKPLELLALLLATPGETLRKAAIFDTLWRDVEVVDAVLANAVSKLRQALGAPHAGFIVTVARQGYRFEGALERIALGRRMASALALAPGMVVPGRAGHRLVQQLGAGGQGETWLAEQPKSGDRRVFKFALDGERLAALKREVTLARVLQRRLGTRPDIVRVLDWNFDSAPFWIECEHGGANLEAWAAAELAALTQAERLALVLQMADALAAAHGAGVLHKDLKPANVLVAPQAGGGSQLRLADFGSGSLLDPGQLERLRLTRLGMTLEAGDSGSGTPYYIAPELLSGGKPSPASDVFGLGVVLFQLLAGDLRRPLAPGWERDITEPLLREDIALATDIDPVRRLGSAAELAQRLRRLDERRARAEAEQARAALAELAQRNAVSDALNRLLREDIIRAANPAASGRADITVADALAGAALQIDTKYADLPDAVRGSLHAALQSALGELSRTQEAVAAGARAAAALERVDSAAVREELPSVRLRLALDLVQLSRLDEARAVLARLEADAAPAGEQPAPFRAMLLFVQSWLTGGEFAFHESLLQLEQAFALVESLSEHEAPGRDKIAFALADNLRLVGRPAEAEALYRRLHAEQVQRHGPDHARTLYTLVGLGSVLVQQQRLDEAEAALRPAAAGLSAALGPAHRQSLTALDMLADVRFRRGDSAGAAADWAHVQAGFAALLGADSSYTLTVQTQRALALRASGHAPEAAALLRDVLGRLHGFADPEAPQSQQVRWALAESLLELGQVDEAAVLAEGLSAEALELAQPEPDWPQRLARLAERLAECHDA